MECSSLSFLCTPDIVSRYTTVPKALNESTPDSIARNEKRRFKNVDMGFIVASVLVASNITNTKEFAYFFLFITKSKKCIKASGNHITKSKKTTKKTSTTKQLYKYSNANSLFGHNMSARRSELASLPAACSHVGSRAQARSTRRGKKAKQTIYTCRSAARPTSGLITMCQPGTV